MQNGAFQKVKAGLYRKLSEIILAALLTVAISIFAYSLNAQAKQAARLRGCETKIALNSQSIEGIRTALEQGDKNLSEKIDSVLERVDQRFDTLEKLINLAIGGKTGGK